MEIVLPLPSPPATSYPSGRCLVSKRRPPDNPLTNTDGATDAAPSGFVAQTTAPSTGASSRNHQSQRQPLLSDLGQQELAEGRSLFLIFAFIWKGMSPKPRGRASHAGLQRWKPPYLPENKAVQGNSHGPDVERLKESTSRQ